LPPIDFYANDIPRITNIEYKELTNYIPTGPERRNAKIYQSNSNNLLLEIENFELIGGQIVTFALWGGSNNLKLLPILDDVNENIRPDETQIRFYNLDSYPITFNFEPYTGSSSRALSSGSGSAYSQVNPGSYRLEVRSYNKAMPVKTVTLPLNPGRIYTVYFIPSVDPSSPIYAQANIPQVVLVVDGNTFFNKCIWT
jgi:Domain of unknown function (DUF4397)